MTVGSYKSYSSLLRAVPPALLLLIGLNIAFGVVTGVVALAAPDRSVALRQALCVSDSAAGLLWRPWTAVTYAFANGNLLQLVFNMMWLYCFGRLFLISASNRALTVTYLSAAAVGAIVYAVIYPLAVSGSAPSLLMGSSAAVIAVAVAVAVIMPDTGLQLPLFGNVRIKWIAGVVVVIFFIGLTSANAGGDLAHLGGAAAGAAAGFMIRRRIKSSGTARRKCDEYSRLADKVRTAGYESLSAGEKRRFFELSADRRKS